MAPQDGTPDRRQPARRRPPREVRDLLQDFGRRQRHNGTTRVTLSAQHLPRYMRRLPAVRKARRWALVLSPEQGERYVEKAESDGPSQGNAA